MEKEQKNKLKELIENLSEATKIFCEIGGGGGGKE